MCWLLAWVVATGGGGMSERGPMINVEREGPVD